MILAITSLLPGWKNLSYACVIPSFCLALYGLRAIYEDPIYLFDYAKIFECKEEIRTIAQRSKDYTK